MSLQSSKLKKAQLWRKEDPQSFGVPQKRDPYFMWESQQEQTHLLC